MSLANTISLPDENVTQINVSEGQGAVLRISFMAYAIKNGRDKGWVVDDQRAKPP